MAVVKFKTTFLKKGSILAQFTGMYKRASDLSPMLSTSGADAMRASVREEFKGGYWLTPNGARVKWAERRDPKPKNPLLRLSNKLMQSWTTKSKGNLSVTPLSLSISSTLPYAKVQRGGTGQELSTAPISKQNIIPRPHATMNPKLKEKLAKLAIGFIKEGDKSAAN